MNLSIIIPAYNEEFRIKKTIDLILKYLLEKNIDSEIIVVDDGSKDRTSFLVKQIKCEEVPISIFSQPENLGKGAAVRRGVMEAKGELILFCDADSSTPIEELEDSIKFINEGYDIVIGSRALNGSVISKRQPFYREYAGRIFNLFVRLILSLNIKYTQCGFKLFKKEVAKKIFAEQKLKGFAFDIEILYAAQRNGNKILEKSVVWKHSAQSKVNLLSDSIKMFFSLIYIRWLYFCE